MTQRASSEIEPSIWSRRLLIAAFLLSLASLFLAPPAGWFAGGLWLWLFLLLCFLTVSTMMPTKEKTRAKPRGRHPGSHCRTTLAYRSSNYGME